MPTTFLYSDPHFYHQGVCNFLRDDGVTKLRPWDDAEEMTEAMVDIYNNVVGEKDKVYFLGDIVMKGKYLKEVMPRLNGDKVLILGNHDIEDAKDYLKYFRDVRAYQIFSGLICSHIPLHTESLGRFKANCHGHLHSNRVKLPNGNIDPRYYNVSVECINYAPITLEQVRHNIKLQGIDTLPAN